MNGLMMVIGAGAMTSNVVNPKRWQCAVTNSGNSGCGVRCVTIGAGMRTLTEACK